MTTDNNHIDQLFREKLGNLEKTPPFGLMPGIKETIIARNKIRRLNQVKTFLSIAAAMMLILMAGWFTMDKDQIAGISSPQQILKEEPAGKAILESAHIPSAPEATRLANNLKQPGNSAPSNPARQTRTTSAKKVVVSVITETPAGNQDTEKGTGAALASAGQSVEQAKDQQSKNEATPAPPKKESGNFQKTTPSRSENKQYYSDNNAANTTINKPENSLKQWSLKAEIAQTFTSMQHFASSNPDGKSGNTVGGGMIASLKVSKKVTISTGIRYAQMQQGTHSSYTLSNTAGIIYLQPIEKKGNITRDVSLFLPAVSSIVYSNGMKTNPENIFISDLSQEFRYLEVPIQANYRLLENKFSVGVTGGISTNFLIGNKATITENGIKLSTGDTNNLRDVIYAGSAGIELGYDLGKRMILTIEPRLKQYLHSVSSNDLVNVKPLQLGIFTGISYSFR
jgi:hypothetical protein